ncbi:MAG: metal-dependent transcriptional regulator, partial [Actinobacteria bacterium]|nr:metal-dependent transcriptional regulator [Actinomycetota bacterium]
TWLIDTLRLPWEAAYHEACRLEHAISAQVEQRMYEALGRPASCPHGNPIADGAPPSAGVPLDTLTVGTAARVTSIGFPIEFRPEYLGYLEAHGVTPGTLLRVQEMPPQSDGRAVRIGDETMFLPSAVASAVRVRRTDAPEAAGR